MEKKNLQLKINVRKSRRKPQRTLHISYTNRACCLSETIFMSLYSGSSIRTADEQFISCMQLSFVNFALHPTTPDKDLTNLSTEIQTSLSR